MKTVTIEHPDEGKVKDVYPIIVLDESGWWKMVGSVKYFYFATSGWREVVEEKDVTDQVKLLEAKTGRQVIDELPGEGIELPNGKRLWFGEELKGRKVQAVVLPPHFKSAWGVKWGNTQGVDSFLEWLKQYQTTCLQIWEGETGTWKETGTWED